MAAVACWRRESLPDPRFRLRYFSGPYFRLQFRNRIFGSISGESILYPSSAPQAPIETEQRSLPPPRGLGNPNLAQLRLPNLARSESRRPAAPARQSLRLRPAGLCLVKAAHTATPRAGGRRPAVARPSRTSETVWPRLAHPIRVPIKHPSPSTIRVHQPFESINHHPSPSTIIRVHHLSESVNYHIIVRARHQPSVTAVDSPFRGSDGQQP